MKPASIKPVRCAIYTRVSTEHPEIIAVKLNRTVHAVRARAYMIGLPLKWFKLKAKAK